MASDLKVRWPLFKFEKADLIWDENPEVSMEWNAMSTSAPIVEPWLNRVMTRCRKEIHESRPDLKADIDDFVRQESNHYRMHESFNVFLEQQGYTIPKHFDEEFEAELRDLLKTKSIAFLSAYCAGFENYTLFSSQFLFEDAGDLFKEGDGGIGDLWLWHFAEEYEHRKVCHDVYAHISGNYFTRVYGLVYSFVHLSKHVNRRIKHFLELYRASMTPEQRAVSEKRHKAYQKRYLKFFVPRMLQILIPYYDPGKAPPSPGLEEALGRYTAMSAPAAAAA